MVDAALMTTRGTLDQVFDELLLVLRPLRGVLSSPENFSFFLEQRGLAFTPAALTSLVGSLAGVRTSLGALLQEGDALGDKLDDGETAAGPRQSFQSGMLALVEQARRIPESLATLGRALPDGFFV